MPKIDLSLYCTIKTAATIAGCGRLTIRRAIKDGRIQGIMIDRQYFALRSSVERFQLDPVGRGRPRIRPADGRN